MEYETVVGLEVHVQTSTSTKMFCSCANEFGSPPNTNVCPVCLGQPGALPVVNKEAVERAMRTSLALGCEIRTSTKFDRKSYYYPDLPKNYQISQYDMPIGEHGCVEFEMDGVVNKIRITRLHMEEDAGKLVHAEGGGASSVDLNRTGVPLMEIVSEPDIRSGAQARAYLEALRRIIRYVGASHCNMEEGSMRCEPNISVRKVGAKEFGTKTEIKNLNSFRVVEDAINYETKRQIKVLESGGQVDQVTMLWDTAANRTRTMRSKEEAHDYRYFPEPDLPPIEISDEWLSEVKNSLGELPIERRRRYVNTMGLSDYDAGVLTAEKPISEYFQRVVDGGIEPKLAANWITQDVLRVLGEKKVSIDELGLTSELLIELLKLIDERVIDQSIARDKVFGLLIEKLISPRKIVEDEGLAMVSDTTELEAIAKKVIEDNPKPLSDVERNPRAAMKYVGLVRKASGGRADAKAVIDIIAQIIKYKTGVDINAK